MTRRSTTLNHWRLFGSCLAFGTLSAGCGDEGGGPAVETYAPLCSDIAGANEREVFPRAVIPTSSVNESLIFGGMDPGSLEPINFELGFRLNTVNVPVTAPADLYVHAIEYTEYQTGWRAGVTDYGVAFHVCSHDVEGQRRVAVQGELAHITSLDPALQTLIDQYEFHCELDAGPEETVNKCTLFIGPGHDQDLTIAEGTLIGQAGGTGMGSYTPGLDFNLLDARSPNTYVNPDRLGSEEGAGRAFRYGACLYDYFAEPMRSAYLAVVGQNGDLRVDPTHPCGTMSIDEAGTPAGVWIRADKASADPSTEIFEVLGNLLVLGPHPVFPGTRQVMSTEVSSLNQIDGTPRLLEFEPAAVGDVNRSVYDIQPGAIHCLRTSGFGVGGSAYFYLQLDADGDTLTIERVAADCGLTPAASRAFTSAALQFVR